MKKLQKTLLIGLGIIYSVGFLALCSFGAIVIYEDYQEDRSIEEYLSRPLPQEVINDLCTRSLIPSTVGVCNIEGLIVEQRYVPDIFRANLDPAATYDEVKNTFEDYEYFCDSPYLGEYTCRYRLGNYVIVLEFDEETQRIKNMYCPIDGTCRGAS